MYSYNIFRCNWDMYGTAFVFPGMGRLSSPDRKCFISKNTADFLQVEKFLYRSSFLYLYNFLSVLYLLVAIRVCFYGTDSSL